MAKLVKEKALLEQPYIIDTEKTVGEALKATVAKLGENMQVRRFVRFNLGEGIEKKTMSFADEVAEQTQAKPSSSAPKAEAKPAEEEAKPAEDDKPAVAISAATVKELRGLTGAGMMDCKKALKETGGDVAAAEIFLKKKGMASADKKAGRTAAEGLVSSYIHAGSRIGVLLELNCETDFVARNPEFKELVDNFAMQIAASPNVEYVSVDDADQEFLAKEREIEMGKEDLQGKPENIRAQIVEGRMAKLVKEKALLEQPYIIDTEKTVGEALKATVAKLGENMQVRRFVRFNLGEGIEKKTMSFADEVAEQTQAKPSSSAPKAEAKPAEEEVKPAEDDKPAVAVSAATVKELRGLTGAGMMDCKKALKETGGDVAAAEIFLKKKGMASADKKAGRTA